MADGDVVRRITISATGQGVDDTTQSVTALGNALSSTTGAADGWGSAISGLGGSFSGLASVLTAGGIVGGLSAILDYTVKANKELADMQTNAKQVGLTLEDFQGIQLGGQIAGLSTDQINTGLQKSSQLLADAAYNSNTLSKELDANGISVKNSNGQLLTQNQLLGVAANLIANAKSPGDEAAIAQMLGFTKEWSPLLEQGSAAMSGLTEEAKKAGAVIDGETIQRATAFDTEWRKSSVEFSSYMKASLSDLLPIMDDLIQRAQKYASSFKASDINAALDSQLKTGGDSAGIPETAVLHIDAEPLSKATEEFQNSPVFSVDTWMNFGKALYAGFKVMSPEQASNEVPGYAASQITEPTYPTEDQMNSAFGKTQSAMDKAQDDAQDSADVFSKVASKVNDANDAYDRAVNTLMKHTDQTVADTEAVGLGAGALAGMRAEASLTSAAFANGTAQTADWSAKVKELAGDAADAALDLAKVKESSDIKFSTDTAFLTPEDLSIATKLKTIYGNDVPAALASTEAAGIRAADALKTIGTLGQTVTSGFAVDFTTAIRNGSSAFTALQTAGVNALGKISDKLVTMATDKVWESAFGGATSSAISSLFGLGGGNLLAGSTSSGTSLAAGTGGLAFPMFASGTDSAPGGWSLVGEKGPEFVNLPKGSQVLPNGQTPGGSTIHAPVSINIDATGADPAGLARVQSQIAQLQATLPSTIVSTVKKAQSGRIL